MSFLKNLFGKPKKKEVLLWCSACGGPIEPRWMAEELAKLSPGEARRALPLTGKVPEGVQVYEGTQCEACGRMYCLNCHDFAAKGPKCPNCGEWRLLPIFRPK